MKMMSRKLAMPLLGVLLWVISIHAGTFATATLLPRPITGVGTATKAEKTVLHSQPDIPKFTKKELETSVSSAHGLVNGWLRFETNFQWAQVHVRKGTPSHGLLIDSRPDEEALKRGRDALVAMKASTRLMSTACLCKKKRISVPECAEHITGIPYESTPLEDICSKSRKRCSQEDILSPYRSIDGTCNNKFDSSEGSANTAYKRLLRPHYMDGIQEPRRAVNKDVMPSARRISTSVIKKILDSDSEWTSMLPEWGRFVEYDLSHTVVNKMVHSDSTIECCDTSGHHLSPRYQHPFCFAIPIPSDDEYYSQRFKFCMTYVRSVYALPSDCAFGPIQQLNQATHFLDGSNIYGTSAKKSTALRSFEKGQLKVTKKHRNVYLPLSPNPSDDCQLKDDKGVCFLSGDSRVNVVPQLTAMHTIWLREHNRVARELSELNPSWDDESLFQEARRIVIAEIQHITYDEWLPQILGKKYFEKIQKYSKYSENVSASVSNSFATATIRVLNSLVDGNLKLYNENRRVNSSFALRNHFNKPNIMEHPDYLDAVIRGLTTQPSQKRNLGFTEDLTTYLFSNGEYGYDIVSLDIQRGRDHGLPAYTAYRSLCGLPEVQTFDDLRDIMSPEVIESLSDVYSSPLDIDLLVGVMSERPISGSLFGPTFSCIFADQFLRTRQGDRYFYTNEQQPDPFSKAQIREIEKVTLARVLCDNGDEIKHMQPAVFRKISDSNGLLSCDSSDIPRMNLEVWRDSRGKYY